VVSASLPSLIVEIKETLTELEAVDGSRCSGDCAAPPVVP
jgi:hypothetical protein